MQMNIATELYCKLKVCMLTAFFLCVVKIKWTDVTLHAQELNSVNLLEYG